MMGRVSIVMSLAPAIGPTLSGLLLDTVGWRWIFGIVLPIALLALGVGARWIHNLGEPTERPDRRPVDHPVGARLRRDRLRPEPDRRRAPRTAAAPRTPRRPTRCRRSTLIVSFGVGVVALGLFIWRQLILQKTDRALLDLRVFRSLNFSLSIAQMGLLSLAFFGAITVVPLYMQSVLQVSAFDDRPRRAARRPGDGPGRSAHRPHLRPLGHPRAADPRLDHREWRAVVLHDLRRVTSVWVIAVAQTVLSHRPRAVVHAAVHGIPRFAAAALLLVRLRRPRHRAAGRRRRGHRAHDHDHGRCHRRRASQSGASEVAAGAAGRASRLH